MKRLLAVFLALVLLGVIATGVAAQSGPAGWYDFETSVRMWQNLRVLGTTALVGAVTTSGNMTTTGNMVAGDNLTVTDNLAVGNLVNVAKQATQEISFDTVIAPAGVFAPISATEAVGTGVVATTTAAAGDLALLYNVGEFTITLTDTAPLIMTGATVLGPSDSLLLIFDGTSWIEVSNAANNDTP
jgi:hypothetical protein